MQAALFLLASAFWSCLLPTLADAQSGPMEIHGTLAKSIEIQGETQIGEDRWAEERTEMARLYDSLLSEQKELSKTKATLEKQVEILSASKAETERENREAAAVRAELESRLEAAADRLEKFVETDLPFLPEERTGRLESVKDTLALPDSGFAEKCRRVFEALSVETDYGQTVESYSSMIEIHGTEGVRTSVVDVLRVGRLALFWRTPDGENVGNWDRAEKRWTQLPNKYRRAINNAVETALKRRTVEMAKLPLGRIVPR